MTRRTKIVATLGPRTREPNEIRAILQAGVDVVRLNFAHDDPETHARAAKLARAEAQALGRTVGVLVDLPGPKIRTGAVRGDVVEVRTGSTFALTSGDEEGDATRVSTTVADLASIVSVGDDVFLADGEIVLRVRSTSGDDVITEVVRGGLLRSRKGLHVPAADRSIEAFTEEDRAALTDALAMNADLIGLSFVRDADDLRRARAALPGDIDAPRLVAKIETASAVEHLDAIVAEADVVMVARGDLGIQTPLEQMPLVQKRIIARCNRAGVPVITATEVLESMTHAPLPSRAEVTDIANAVFDGTDALMLSEETAVGNFAAAAVRTMARTTAVADAARPALRFEPVGEDDEVSWAVAHAAVEAAGDVWASAILCPTRTGATPRRVASFRPPMPVVALSQRQDTLGASTVVWGVVPLYLEELPEVRDTNEDVARAIDAAYEAGLVDRGELVAVVAGSPGPRAGSTDFLRIARV